ncbi:MAG: hypothetical protein CML66_30330 [Rhodobacteraceae bacterium]|nr:hypothetical protein [Paracoccaceae bacterium]MAY45594.1 hypothetical protein [Paracoccaceae bacterium]
MRTRPGLAFVLILAAGPALAQEPLSAIDWLRRNPPRSTSPQIPLGGLRPAAPGAHPGIVPPGEPPVTDGISAPAIEVTSLDAIPVAVGIVPSTVTGLPATLWQGSSTATLTRLVANAPVTRSPAMQSLLYTLMLAEAQPPSDATGRGELTLAMIDRLIDLGAVEPAEALARRAGPTRSPELFQRWFDTSLLTGTEDTACATLAANPYLAADYAPRIYCEARRGDWPAAALMLDTAFALGDLDKARAALLDRFLNADLDDLTPPPSLPVTVDALDFRLYEAIGERLPTQTLPRAFSNADLRDVAGWKAQVEAAERLARTGALSANRFLGIYTEREPAASGGVWDRVQAVQRFETALSTGNASAIGKTLRPAWDAMRAARTEVTFATLFADRLAGTPPETAAARELAWHVRLLSDQYERAARDAPDTADAAFLAGIATGRPVAQDGDPDLKRAIAAGFAEDAALPMQLAALRDRGALGEMVLRSIALYRQGVDGNPEALTDALAAFRSVGLEDTARRAALQLMLLEPRS